MYPASNENGLSLPTILIKIHENITNLTFLKEVRGPKASPNQYQQIGGDVLKKELICR